MFDHNFASVYEKKNKQNVKKITCARNWQISPKNEYWISAVSSLIMKFHLLFNGFKNICSTRSYSWLLVVLEVLNYSDLAPTLSWIKCQIINSVNTLLKYRCKHIYVQIKSFLTSIIKYETKKKTYEKYFLKLKDNFTIQYY